MLWWYLPAPSSLQKQQSSCLQASSGQPSLPEIQLHSMCTLCVGHCLVSQLPCRCPPPSSLSWAPTATSCLVWLLFPPFSKQRCSTCPQVPSSLLLVPEIDGLSASTLQHLPAGPL